MVAEIRFLDNFCRFSLLEAAQATRTIRLVYDSYIYVKSPLIQPHALYRNIYLLCHIGHIDLNLNQLLKKLNHERT